MYVPLTRLYAVITAAAPASTTAVRKAGRYSSRSARSLTAALTSNRSCSWLLATKCLTVAPTPVDWIPRIVSPAVRAVRCGSSL
jgi:hypothetical protein